jgi:hypothetical protein
VPAWLAILLAVLTLGVVVALVFAAWRLVANLKALARSVADLNRQLAPALEDLARQSEQTAAKAAALSRRGAAAAGTEPKAG